MQTFITDHDMVKSAANLDNKRLGKQRVEATQILNTLLGISSGWRNHPAVRMWKGNEGYLLYNYLIPINNEWKKRGFNSCQTDLNIIKLKKALYDKNDCIVIKPLWITDEFIESHRSRLIAKYPSHYKPIFPNTEEGLAYVWPV